MIVQYIIDWSYVRRCIHSAQTDDALELLRTRLRVVRMDLKKCGILLLDDGNRLTKDLVGAISDLRQDDESNPIAAWDRLSKELEAYKQMYLDCVLRVGEVPSIDNTLRDVLSKCRAFLIDARVWEYNLPGILVSAQNDVDVNQLGSGYQQVDFSEFTIYETISENGWFKDSQVFNQNEENAFKQYLAGISLVASCFHEVTFQDPYIITAFNGERGESRWRMSLKQILKTITSNPKVECVRLITETNSLCGLSCNIKWLLKALEARHGRTSNLRLSLHLCKPSNDFHNRYIYIDDVVPVCELSKGFDMYGKNGQIHRAITVTCKEVGASDCHGVDGIERHSFGNALSWARHEMRQNQFSCDLEDWQIYCRPNNDLRSTFEYEWHPANQD